MIEWRGMSSMPAADDNKRKTIAEIEQKYSSLPPWQWSHLNPRRWHIWALLWITRALACLPMGCIIWGGKKLGRLATRFFGNRRRIVARNLELCFPGLPPEERERMLLRNFEHYGIALLGSGLSFVANKNRYDRLFRVEGTENLKRPISDGRPILFVSYHTTSLNIGCRVVHLAAKEAGISSLHAAYREHNDPVMDYVTLRCRIGASPPTSIRNVPRSNVRDMVRLLKNGRCLLMLTDQDHGRRHSVFVPFFGQPAATAPVVHFYARTTNAAVVPLRFHLDEQNKQYVLHIDPPLDNFPTKDQEADTARINQMMEQAIRKRPEQYLWAHRRFKTRPSPDDPPLY